MTIRIRKPGIFTTLQNLGRTGYRSLGVGPGGAMDRTAVRLINALTGNDENSAVLEMHFPAAEIVFESETHFALGGADFDADLKNEKIDNWRCWKAEAGSVLKFRGSVKGHRCYVAVVGGFDFEAPLGSPSVQLNGDAEIRITGEAGRTFIGENTRISNSLLPIYSRFPTVRIIDGPEAYLLTDESGGHFINEQFTVLPASNRMGFRLQRAPLSLSVPFEMVSSGVCFGTIQLLPDGQMIVLMADHQTTGGYPRIGQVASVDLPLLAQLGAGCKVAFHRVSISEAEELAMQFERDLELMKLGIRMRT